MKNVYETPTTTVVELQTATYLLQGSPNSLENYLEQVEKQW